jgi:hypothetical protein
MRQRRTRLCSTAFIAALAYLVLGVFPHGGMRLAWAAERSLSDAQLKNINASIADQGRDVAISAVITDILGLTSNNQTISCRAFAALDPRGDNEVHQVYLLPDAKGYLVSHFYKDKIDIYWTDKNFVLIAALTGVRGERPAAASFLDAQYGFGFELKWWANFADKR